MPDLVFTTASELATMIARKEASAFEVLEAHLEHLARHNPALNAVVTLDEDDARQRAAAADEALAAGESWGPLHGVPMTVKDALETAGMRTTAGFPPLEGYIPGTDATAVARLRAAGAIIYGKTNLPPLAIGYRCENPLAGRTVNPWDDSRTPGGSSGGAAAAVAAGLSPLEVGSDLAGSVRQPAHYCGVFGLKPTEHRIPDSGHIPPPPGTPRNIRHMGTLGPLARSLDDLRLALQLLAGPDGRGWEVPPVPLESAEPPELSDLTVAWTVDFGGIPVTADTRAAVERFAARLEAHGCRVEQAAPERFDFPAVWDTWGELCMAELGAVMTPAQREEFLAGLDPADPLEAGQLRTADATVAEFTVTLDKRDRFIGALEWFLGDVDVWLCPTSATPAVPYGGGPGAPVSVDEATVPHLVGGFGHCAPFNLTGNPAVTTPVGFSAQGLPIGCQLVGAAGTTCGCLPWPSVSRRSPGRLPRLPATANRSPTAGQRRSALLALSGSSRAPRGSPADPRRGHRSGGQRLIAQRSRRAVSAGPPVGRGAVGV